MARPRLLDSLAGGKSRYGILAFLFLLPFVFFWRETLGLRILGDQDAIFWFFPAYHQVVEQIRSGQIPLWNPYVYGGMPLFASWQAGVLDQLNLLYVVLGVSSRTLTLVQQLSFSLAALSTFAYSRSIGINRRGSLVAGVVFAFSGYAVARTLYPGLLHVTAIVPLVLYFIERLYAETQTKRSWRLAIAGALIFAWQILAGHPQPLVYSSLLAFAYILFRGFASGLPGASRIRFLAQSALIFVAGAALASVQLLPAYEFARHSVRQEWSFEMFTLHSLHPLSLVGAVVPFLHGGGEGIYHLRFWGPYWHHNEAQIYLGVLALSLGVAGAVAAWQNRNRVGIFWTITALSGVILVLGKYAAPVAWLLYRIPLVGSFRSSNRYWVFVALAVAILAGYAVDRLLSNKRISARVVIGVPVAITTCLVLFAVLMNVRPRVLSWFIRSDTPEIPFSAGAGTELWIPVLIAVLSTVLIVGFVKTRGSQRYYWLLLALILDFSQYAGFAPIGARWGVEDRLGSAVKDQNSERSHLLINPNAGEFSPLLFYGQEMVAGYDPLLNARFKRFTGIDEAGRSHLASLMSPSDRTLDLLNVRKVIVAPQILSTRDFVGRDFSYRNDVLHSGRWQFQEKLEATPDYQEYRAFENTQVLPRAWLVRDVRVAHDEDQLKMIRGEGEPFDPMTMALISPDDVSRASGLNRNSEKNAYRVVVTGKSAGMLKLAVETEQASLLVVGDLFDEGWTARVNGEDSHILRVDYILRGIVLPRGKHDVEFSYRPLSFRIGAVVSMLTALGLVGL